MTLDKSFWPAFLLAALVCGGALQAVAIARIGLPFAKPALPIPG
jgi:hypothetical protein